MLSEKPIQAVINFVVDKEAIIERITSRRVCSVCGYPHNIISDPPKEGNICKKCGGKVIHRKDDTEDTVKNRLAVYEEKTAPLVEYYRKKGFLHNIDGNQSVENVRKSIDDVIHNIRA
jgi:adenylate kinase